MQIHFHSKQLEQRLRRNETFHFTHSNQSRKFNQTSVYAPSAREEPAPDKKPFLWPDKAKSKGSST